MTWPIEYAFELFARSYFLQHDHPSLLREVLPSLLLIKTEVPLAASILVSFPGFHTVSTGFHQQPAILATTALIIKIANFVL